MTIDPNLLHRFFEFSKLYDQENEIIEFGTSREALDALCEKLPHRLPPLYEQMILSWRWTALNLGRFQLLANPLGADLDDLYDEITRDKTLAETLLPQGYVQFGKHENYDPICFDTRHRRSNADCPVVQIDHEQILCNNRIKRIEELAPTFAELIKTIVGRPPTLK